MYCRSIRPVQDGQVILGRSGFEVVKKSTLRTEGQLHYEFLLISDRPLELECWSYNTAGNSFCKITHDHLITACNKHGNKRVEATTHYLDGDALEMPLALHRELICTPLEDFPVEVDITLQTEKVYDPNNRVGGFEKSSHWVYKPTVKVANRGHNRHYMAQVHAIEAVAGYTHFNKPDWMLRAEAFVSGAEYGWQENSRRR